MKKLFAALLLAVAPLLGCDPVITPNPTNPDNPDKPVKVNALIEVQLPTAANVFLDGHLVAENTILAEANVEDLGFYEIISEKQNYLFVEKSVEVDKDTTKLTVTYGPGEYGLAPNGVYTDDNNGSEITFESDRQDNGIIMTDGAIEYQVNDNSFTGTWIQSDSVTREYAGQISADLCTITYTRTTYFEGEASGTSDFSLTSNDC